MNSTPRRSALGRADLVDAIACGLPELDGETPCHLSLSHDTSNFRQDEQDLQGYIGGFQWCNPANPVHPVKVIDDDRPHPFGLTSALFHPFRLWLYYCFNLKDIAGHLLKTVARLTMTD